MGGRWRSSFCEGPSLWPETNAPREIGLRCQEYDERYEQLWYRMPHDAYRILLRLRDRKAAYWGDFDTDEVLVGFLGARLTW